MPQCRQNCRTAVSEDLCVAALPLTNRKIRLGTVYQVTNAPPLELTPDDLTRLAALTHPLCDPRTWSAWFPGVRSASYRGGGPYGPGSIREAHVGLARYEEVMVAWEELERWAYYVDRATVPLAHAQLECTEFQERGTGTRLRWTLASDPRLLLRLASPIFQSTVQRLFERATANLEALLRQPDGSGSLAEGAP